MTPKMIKNSVKHFLIAQNTQIECKLYEKEAKKKYILESLAQI